MVRGRRRLEPNQLSVGVRNFGPISDASLDVLDFNVLVGKNNVGKSIFCQVLFAFLDQHAKAVRVHRFYPAAWSYARRAARVAKEYRDEPASFLETLAKEMSGWMANDLAEDYRKKFRAAIVPTLDSVFATDVFDLIGPGDDKAILSFRQTSKLMSYDLELRLYQSRRIRLRAQIAPRGGALKDAILRTWRRQNQFRDASILLERLRATPRPRELEEMFFSFLFSILRNWEIQPGTYYIPAGRAGLLEGWNTYAQALVGLSSMPPVHRIDIPPIPGPAARFYQVLLGLTGKRGYFGGLVSEREVDLISGRASFEQPEAPYGKIQYSFRTSTGDKKTIDIISASSMVKELAPLVMIISERVDPNDVLIVEEPESHLHPGAQFRLVDFLTELAKRRVVVMMTTHSDILVRRVGQVLSKGGGKTWPESTLAFFQHHDGVGTKTETRSLKPPVDIETFDDVLRELYEGELEAEYGSGG